MREKAIKLLNDEQLRQKCVIECNYAIEQNGRWIHRIKELQDFLNIQLIDAGEPKSKGIEYLYLCKEPEEQNPTLSYRIKRKKKNIINGLFLILNELPIISKMFSEKYKQKLIRSIIKYNDNKYFKNIYRCEQLLNKIENYRNVKGEND